MKPLYGKGGGGGVPAGAGGPQFGSLYDLFTVTFREQWVVQKFLPGGEGRRQASSWSTASSPARSTGCRRRTICAPTWCAAAPRKETDLTPREREICTRIGPALRERGLIFVGIDVIDGFLTEINVTSPTGIRAVKNLGGADVAALIWDKIEAKRRG
jgi:glutathione synthase